MYPLARHVEHDSVEREARAGDRMAWQAGSPCTHLRTDLFGESMMVDPDQAKEHGAVCAVSSLQRTE